MDEMSGIEVEIKSCPKIAKGIFNRKMNDFDTSSEIASNLSDLGQKNIPILVTLGESNLYLPIYVPRYQYEKTKEASQHWLPWHRV